MRHTLFLLTRVCWCSALALAVSASAPAADVSGVDAYFARRIWPAHTSPIENGVILVQRGRILAVGNRGGVTIPADARIHELGESVVIPGLVVAETELGSGSADGEYAVAPHLKAIDGFDFFDNYESYLAGGVTTVQIAPGRSRLMPGQGAVVKLAGPTVAGRTLAETESLRIILSAASRTPPRVFDPPVGAVSVERPLRMSRAQLAENLAGAVSGLRAVFEAAEAPLPSAGDADDIEMGQLLAAVAAYRQPGRTVRITATTASEIRAALMLAEELRLQLLLVEPRELDRFEPQLRAGLPALRGVVLRVGVRPGQLSDTPIPSVDQQPQRTTWDLARLLVDCGFKCALRTAANEDLSELLFLGGLFRQSGLSQQQLLQMCTLWPAELLGTSERVGSLEPGKDADFVVLNGEPFRSRTRVLATYVSGRRVYAFPSPQNQTARVIRAAAIHDGTGRIIRQGALVIENGVIRGIGRDVSAPYDAIEQRFAEGVVVPGFLDLGTKLGLGGPLSGTVSLETRLGEQLFAGDPAVSVARQGGVTSVLLGPAGTSPGPVVAFKLNDNLRVLRDPVALKFSLQGNLTSAVPAARRLLEQGRSYAGRWTQYEAQLGEYNQKLKAYEADKAKYDAAVKAAEEEKEKSPEADEKPDSNDEQAAESNNTDGAGTGSANAEEGKDAEKTQDPQKGEQKPAAGESKSATPDLKPPTKPTPPVKPQVIAGLEPYRALFAGKIPALVEADKPAEISEAIALFHDEFSTRTLIVGADDLFRLDDEFAGKKQLGLVLGPQLVRTVQRRTVNLPQVLASRELPFGFQSQATTGAKDLPRAVQFAVHKGLGPGDALAGLTSTAAMLLSLDEHIGTLAVGRDADLLVMSGPPLELSSEVLAVMIDGKWVYQKEDNP